MFLSSCYPIRRVGLLQERTNLPEYEKGVYEQYHLQKNDELEMRVISLNPETALLFQQHSRSSFSSSWSVNTPRIDIIISFFTKTSPPFLSISHFALYCKGFIWKELSGRAFRFRKQDSFHLK